MDGKVTIAVRCDRVFLLPIGVIGRTRIDGACRCDVGAHVIRTCPVAEADLVFRCNRRTAAVKQVAVVDVFLRPGCGGLRRGDGKEEKERDKGKGLLFLVFVFGLFARTSARTSIQNKPYDESYHKWQNPQD